MDGAPFVSNAGPLIALAQIDRLWLLPRLMSGVIVPPAVAREITPILPQPPAWIVERPLSRPVHEVVVASSLDPGETEAIGPALELGAPGIVLDDRQARRLARASGLGVVGTLGVLLLARRRGLLLAVRPELEALSAARFHVASALAQDLLRDAGED